MVVGVRIIEVFIANSRSLKEKRGIFNISIAEIGDQNSWKRGRIGFAVVGNDRNFVNSMINKILRFIEDLQLVEVIRSKMEIITISDVVDDRYGYQDDKYY
ncbi:MAG: hypothetical protein B1H13_13015 [Desulfobacteraceae bacterium 4484_190.3]|nr:MAG: hypothetical protein B1H13_13015 [Desulfobacteraceae bacterium 4484_190.3]